MAPKRHPPANVRNMSSNDHTSDKEMLLNARALKRAERVKARHVEAEKHKEVVRNIASPSVHFVQTNLTENSHRTGKHPFSRGGVPKGHRGVRSRNQDSRSQPRVPLKYGCGMAEA